MTKFSTKQKIAKEIIILFSSFILTVIIIFFIWIINTLSVNFRSNRILKEISQLNIQCDSIKSTFPKAVPFEYIINCQLPQDFYKIDTLKEIKNIKIKNLVILHKLLSEKAYFPMKGIKTIRNGKEIILPPLDIDLNFFLAFKLEQLDDSLAFSNYHNHLFSNNCISVSLSQFFYSLNGIPEPPSSQTNLLFQDLITIKNKIEAKLRNIENQRLSYSTYEMIALRTLIIIFTVIYPIRFIILILIWSFKILRTRDE